MVLESLIQPLSAEQRPWKMFFVGLLFASVAIFLSLWIFKDQASLIMVFLTVIACIPLIHTTLKFEESKDERKNVKEIFLLKEHSKALSFFMFLFLGITIAFSLWYILLPENLVQSTFNTQIATINAINSRVFLGGTINTAALSKGQIFNQILLNNFKVLFFCIFFSFFYGAGAIFILTWNASVISAAIGIFFRRNISEYLGLMGLAKIAAHFHIFSAGLLRYFIHGIPEILAYFIGALAGGIISIAVIRHDFGTERFKHVLYDSLDLLILAILTVIFAAFIEVYITPIFF